MPRKKIIYFLTQICVPTRVVEMSGPVERWMVGCWICWISGHLDISGLKPRNQETKKSNTGLPAGPGNGPVSKAQYAGIQNPNRMIGLASTREIMRLSGLDPAI